MRGIERRGSWMLGVWGSAGMVVVSWAGIGVRGGIAKETLDEWVWGGQWAVTEHGKQ